MNPIQVLRDAAYAAVTTNAGPTDISTDDYSDKVLEALKQVEALVEAASQSVDIGDETNRCRICWDAWGFHENDCALTPFQR